MQYEIYNIYRGKIYDKKKSSGGEKMEIWYWEVLILYVK